MLNTKIFGNQLKLLGYNFYSGVPCSFLKYFINYAINSCNYIAAANEGDAVAIAAGAYLGNKKSVVLMQNSGFGSWFSTLTANQYAGAFFLPQEPVAGIFVPVQWRHLCGRFGLAAPLGARQRRPRVMSDDYYQNAKEFVPA